MGFTPIIFPIIPPSRFPIMPKPGAVIAVVTYGRPGDEIAADYFKLSDQEKEDAGRALTREYREFLLGLSKFHEMRGLQWLAYHCGV